MEGGGGMPLPPPLGIGPVIDLLYIYVCILRESRGTHKHFSSISGERNLVNIYLFFATIFATFFLLNCSHYWLFLETKLFILTI